MNQVLSTHFTKTTRPRKPVAIRMQNIPFLLHGWWNAVLQLQMHNKLVQPVCQQRHFKQNTVKGIKKTWNCLFQGWKPKYHSLDLIILIYLNSILILFLSIFEWLSSDCCAAWSESEIETCNLVSPGLRQKHIFRCTSEEFWGKRLFWHHSNEM